LLQQPSHQRSKAQPRKRHATKNAAPDVIALVPDLFVSVPVLPCNVPVVTTNVDPNPNPVVPSESVIHVNNDPHPGHQDGNDDVPDKLTKISTLDGTSPSSPSSLGVGSHNPASQQDTCTNLDRTQPSIIPTAAAVV
jgi:hypothetical protein